jgi:hypothetical protein
VAFRLIPRMAKDIIMRENTAPKNCAGKANGLSGSVEPVRISMSDSAEITYSLRPASVST